MSETSEMLEKVARALCEAWEINPDAGTGDRPAWKSFDLEARAAIQAMREPTEEMLFAADWLENGTRGAWYAMIDAALVPESKQGNDE